MSIYLDNAATSFPKPEQVYQAAMQALQQVGASPGRGSYGRALDASRLVLDTREAAAQLVNCADSSRIVFTSNATMALNLATIGTLQPGDHVVTSSMEHNSLLRPLFMLEKAGVELTIVSADPQGLVDPDQIRQALRKNTRMIAVAHVSNVTGGIQDIRQIAGIAQTAGVLMLLDAAQSAGTLPLDMQALGIDLLAAPGHKGLLGPQGTGFLAVAPGVQLRPIMAGGTGSSSDQDHQPDTFPEGFEAGTHNLSGIAGLGAGLGFLLETGVARVGQHEQQLAEHARQRLEGMAGCSLFGPINPEQRSGVVSLTIEGWDPAILAFYLDREYGIAVRAGLHCAPRAHRTIGSYPTGTLRISPGWFNTLADVE
ncbi:MAG: aminotransferase class V-fold PLP-dependent enzyme, partial [Trichlorobacter sp.]|uniref:aminotransferase class V-fold PLP-dependent enzyme n=1 Tax=Trichlorobacter sp. TaxID=2911007 RepID=UPI002562E947